MSQFIANPSAPRNWRDLPQPVTPRAMSREGRKRLVLAIGNVVGLVVLLGATAWGLYEIRATWEHNPERLIAPTDGAPLRGLAVHSDGVLDRAWVETTLALPPGASLMQLDLAQLQQRLLAGGQVRTAVLTRRFPDVLAVALQERQPVVRLLAQAGAGAPQTLLVARDGVVYPGNGYPPEQVAALPFLDGVRLVPAAGGGFVPLEGLDAVALLLDTARDSAAGLLAGFRVVSLARFAPDRVLVVRSAEVPEIVFGLRDDFSIQLAHLASILQRGSAKSVNLAVGGNQVPVVPEDPLPVAGRGPSVRPAPLAVPPGPGRVFFPSPNPPTQRDI